MTIIGKSIKKERIVLRFACVYGRFLCNKTITAPTMIITMIIAITEVYKAVVEMPELVVVVVDVEVVVAAAAVTISIVCAVEGQ